MISTLQDEQSEWSFYANLYVGSTMQTLRVRTTCRRITGESALKIHVRSFSARSFPADSWRQKTLGLTDSRQQNFMA